VEKRIVIALAIFPPLALGLLNDIYLEPLYRRYPLWFWVVDITQFVVVPALVLVFLVRAGSITPRDYGFGPFAKGPRTAEDVGLCVFMCAVFWLAYEPIKLLGYRFLWPHVGTFGYGSVLPESFFPRLGIVFYFSATAALVEESLFRGLPWLYLSQLRLRRHRVPIYVFSTSLLFAAIHSEQGPHGILATFSLGLVAAMLYARIQNLWPFVVGHFVTDIASFWGSDF